MSSIQLLPFQRRIYEQLTAPAPDSDGLLLLARGLGMRSILCCMVETFTEDESLVVIVNATPEEEQGIAAELGQKLTIVGFEMPAKDRLAAYKKGGVLSITTRILIIDMLLDRIPVPELTGLVILHAEDVTPTSMEAFVMRVYREKNKTGFIKAFSDEPESFTYGVAPLQTVLTQLHIRNVFLYPRFHEAVNADLAKVTGDVLNLHQPLSDSMDIIQTAIIECMEATLAELKRSNTVIEVEELSVTNALFRSFDTVIKAQLDPQWHKIGPKTRGLVYDLSTLRQLLTYLLSFDAVSFNQFLETILASNTTNLTTGKAVQNQSPWLYLPAADTIFQTARNRVYRKVAVQPEKEESTAPVPAQPAKAAPANGNGQARADRESTEDAYWNEGDDSIFADEAVLAASQSAPSTSTASPAKQNGKASGNGANPTEEEEIDNTAELFRNITSNNKDKERGTSRDTPVEIPEDFYHARRKEPWAYWCPAGSQPVLEEQPKWFLLREILEEVEAKMHWDPVDMEDTSNDIILVMCASARTVTTLRKYLASVPELDRDMDGEGSSSARNTGGRDLLLARASEYFLWKGSIGNMSKNIQNAAKTSIGGLANPLVNGGQTTGNTKDVNYESAALKRKNAYKHGQAINKRRRVRGGGASGSSSDRSSTKGKQAAGSSTSILEAEAEELASGVAASMADGTSGLLPNSLQEPDEEFDPIAFNEYFGICRMEETVVIRAYAGDEDDRMLQELRPKSIILYDPDQSFVRRIETYRAAHPGVKISTHFMIYANSAEEQRYLAHTRRERESFERLIRERSSMAIPLQADRRPNEDRSDDFLRAVNTRVAGGGKHARADPPNVVVDVREFRSSLPSLLHAAGFIVVPLTLTIGDYVLSPDLVVERKSLPDLIQSFNSGRLYQQCEVMSTHYKVPILLIEFDQKKSFSLETYSDVKGNANSQFNQSNSDTDLHSKLVLLTLTFPRLRIIWSSSPYATADIFADLKTNRDEPDAAKAAAIGAEEGGDPNIVGEVEVAVNQTPQEILRSLPGITTKNFRYLMDKVDNMEELTRMELAGINELIGVEAGRQLHTFLNHSLLKRPKARPLGTAETTEDQGDSSD